MKICGICGRINHKQQKESPTDIADEHRYWGRKNLPQIAQMSTDTGIYKICEYLESVGESNLKQNDIKKRRRFKILKK